MNDYSSLSDNQLIEEVKKGHYGAFQSLVFRHDKQVLSLAARYAESAEDAKDIYQEVFLRVYRGLSKFQMRCEFKTWLFRITTNVCLSFCKKRRHYLDLTNRLLNGKDVEGQPVQSNNPGEGIPHKQMVNDEISSRVANALNLLSPQQKLIFMLRHYEGYKMREIARFIRCTEGTVKKQLFTAIRKLRRDLKDLYIEGVST